MGDNKEAFRHIINASEPAFQKLTNPSKKTENNKTPIHSTPEIEGL